ncbi:MAG: hypothetical protein ABF258_02505, partial [Flavobacteriales bacterium]
MKFFIGIITSVFSVFVIWFLLSLFSEVSVSVNREIETSQDPQLVWNELSDFNNWGLFSQSSSIDKTHEDSISVLDIAVNEMKERGKKKDFLLFEGMTIINTVGLQKMEYQFNTSFNQKGKGAIVFVPAKESLLISWSEKVEFSFFEKPLSFFIQLDKIRG